MDADIFSSGKKKLRIQKYPHTYGRGLRDIISIGANKTLKTVNKNTAAGIKNSSPLRPVKDLQN